MYTFSLDTTPISAINFISFKALEGILNAVEYPQLFIANKFTWYPRSDPASTLIRYKNCQSSTKTK